MHWLSAVISKLSKSSYGTLASSSYLSQDTGQHFTFCNTLVPSLLSPGPCIEHRSSTGQWQFSQSIWAYKWCWEWDRRAAIVTADLASATSSSIRTSLNFLPVTGVPGELVQDVGIHNCNANEMVEKGLIPSYRFPSNGVILGESIQQIHPTNVVIIILDGVREGNGFYSTTDKPLSLSYGICSISTVCLVETAAHCHLLGVLLQPPYVSHFFGKSFWVVLGKSMCECQMVPQASMLLAASL